MLLSKAVRFFSENAGPPSPVDGNFNIFNEMFAAAQKGKEIIARMYGFYFFR